MKEKLFLLYTCPAVGAMSLHQAKSIVTTEVSLVLKEMK